MRASALAGAATAMILMILGLIYIGDSYIPLPDEPYTPYIAAPGTCTEDMDCWDCATMGNGICGAPETPRWDKACRLAAKAARQTGPWEAFRATEQAYRASIAAEVLEQGSTRLTDALGAIYRDGVDARDAAQHGLGVCD